jgi:uncharacterized protein YoxC
MWPQWVGVVTALSLAIIAVAAIAVAVATILAARAGRSLLRTVEQVAGPALSDVRQLVGTIRHEADALVGTSRDIRQRIVRAADAAEAKLSEIHALADFVQEEVEDTVMDAAVALKRVRTGFSLIEWGKKALRKRKRRR